MRAPTTDQIDANQGVLKFGLLAYLAAALSLIICYLKGFANYFGPTVGLAPIETATGQTAVMNPHLQAVLMWLFAALAVVALTFDRKKHGDNIPLLIGVVALIVIVGTLYAYYVGEILTFGYILLVLAAFLNHNRMLSFLNRKVLAQASELVELNDSLGELNDSLEQRVENQVEEIERLSSVA